MFVDELEIYAKAGDGGNGVVRWRREKFKPKGGPAGGNGGKGGDVYMRAVRNVALLQKYTGSKEFKAEPGEEGRGSSQNGKDGNDLYIEVPVGATVTDRKRGRVHRFEREGETHKVLLGGKGGLGNEYFKSSTNRAPQNQTDGKKGEEGAFMIELALLVDVGLIGYPNAGKSTLLNTLTNATAKVGSYPFTTLEPHLGDFHRYILADIPGLIAGASEGKGLGHKFLRHIRRTKMLVHCISLEHENTIEAYTTIRRELETFDTELLDKEEWIILTKSDLTSPAHVTAAKRGLEAHTGKRVFSVSAQEGVGMAELEEALIQKLTST